MRLTATSVAPTLRASAPVVAVIAGLLALSLGGCGSSSPVGAPQSAAPSPMFAGGSGNATAPASAPSVTVTVTTTVTATTPAESPLRPPAPVSPTVAQSPLTPATGQAPTPQQVLQAVQRTGVPLVVEDGWDQEWDLPSRQSDWFPIGVMLHHTAANQPGIAPSRQFLLDYQSTMVLTDYDGLAGGGRGCNVLIGRDGTVYLMRATRGPHAGIGGPMMLGADELPSDNANGRLFGIEIESAGTSAEVVPGSDFVDGFGEAQVESTAKVSAALLALVGRGPENLTDHKAWAGVKQGKPDLVGDSLETFRARTRTFMG